MVSIRTAPHSSQNAQLRGKNGTDAVLFPPRTTADEAGWVSVDKATTRHTKYPNVFSLGDASSLPNSKTAAAITAQAPVLVHNLVAASRGGGRPSAEYDGYASCPLLTGHGELMLCEFKYGGVPKETFANVLGGQEVPNRLFYHLKKDLFVSLPPFFFVCVCAAWR